MVAGTATLYLRMDTTYSDKLDSKILEDFWQRKQDDWQKEEPRIKSLIAGLEEDHSAERPLKMKRILDLAQNAYFLYLTRKPAKHAELLKMVLLSCSIDAVSLYPTYRKPFDMIFKRTKRIGRYPASGGVAVAVCHLRESVFKPGFGKCCCSQ